MVGFLMQILRTFRLLSRVLAEPEGRGLAGLVATQFLAGLVLQTAGQK
jgi:hypothetical protein